MESGKRRIGCHTRNVVIDMRDPAPDQDARPHSHRRLSDLVLITFHFACDEGDLETAEQLLTVLGAHAITSAAGGTRA